MQCLEGSAFHPPVAEPSRHCKKGVQPILKPGLHNLTVAVVINTLLSAVEYEASTSHTVVRYATSRDLQINCKMINSTVRLFMAALGSRYERYILPLIYRCGFFFLSLSLPNRTGHYTLQLCFLSSFFLAYYQRSQIGCLPQIYFHT